MTLRMPQFASLASCGAVFAILHITVNIFHATYYAVAMSWPAIAVQTLIICVAGILGYLVGSMMLARDFSLRTISFIVIFGYFVSYSVTNLLGSIITSPWLFVLSVFVVTAFITAKIGPRWERVPD